MHIEFSLKFQGAVPSIRDLVITNDYYDTFTYSQTNTSIITSLQNVNTTMSIQDMFGNTGKQEKNCVIILQQTAHQQYNLETLHLPQYNAI